jgi:transglutaminase-like putative cysteine protease
MSRLHIHHRTEYRYTAPVKFGLHRLVLRPRESHDTTVVRHHLSVLPKARLTWMNDVFGNHIAFAEFPEPAEELVIDSLVTIDRVDRGEDPGAVEPSRVSQMTFPLSYLQYENAIVEAYGVPVYPDEAPEIRSWAQAIIGQPTEMTALEAVRELNAVIFRTVNYRKREEPGVQSPMTTLQLGTGSCRDMATLGIEAIRSIGVAARFVSGYLNSLASLAGHGSTHAWLEAYLPDCGWCGFDATSGKATSRNQIPLGVSSHPRGVMPISGRFDRSTGSSLGMSVKLSIQHEAVEGSVHLVV